MSRLGRNIFVACLVCCGITASMVTANSYAYNSPKDASSKSQQCFNSAMTQMALDQCASGDLTQSDASVTALYKQLLLIYAGNRGFVERLKDSQMFWLVFIQSQLTMKYPHNDEPDYYGTVFPMCADEYLSSLYLSRVEALLLSQVKRQADLEGSPKTLTSSASVLKRLYHSITIKYAHDKAFMLAFQTANADWLDYQGAQLAAMFPNGTNVLFDGTPMDANHYLNFLRMQRILELKDWVSGIAEGDVCSGSVKTPEELSGSK